MDNPPVDICSDSFRCCLFLAPDEKQPVMSEDQNIEQSPEDGKSERPEEVNENISPEQIIAPAESSNQTSEIPKSDIQNMEVHHHPHVDSHMGRKISKNIFWNS